MLYQPSNIVPSEWAGEGQNVVDPNDNIKISWQVNGNSPMTAFTITIYRNTGNPATDATPVTTINGVPDATLYPNGFYPVDGQGNQQYFTYEPLDTKWINVGITSGKSYRYKITQIWGANNTVEQIAYSTFITRTSPSLMFYGNEQDGRVLNFASYQIDIPNSLVVYSQAQGDPIQSTRWVLYRYNSAETEIVSIDDDTGWIITSDPSYCFNGPMPGTHYRIYLSIRTISGQEASTSIRGYVSNETEGSADISIYKTGEDSVSISVGGIYSFPAEKTTWGRNGTIQKDTTNKSLVLTKTAYVTWSNITIRSDGQPDNIFTMRFTCLIDSSTLSGRTFESILTLNSSGAGQGDMIRLFIPLIGNNQLKVEYNSSVIATYNLSTFQTATTTTGNIYTISVLIQGHSGWTELQFSNGQTVSTSSAFSFGGSFLQLNGPQVTKELLIYGGGINGGIDRPFLLQFEDDSLDGGNYTTGSAYQIIIIRESNGRRKVISVSPTAYNNITDYPPSGTHRYIAYQKKLSFFPDIVPYITNMATSQEICTEDRKYVLLECVKSDDLPSMYKGIKKWVFDSNMSNGSIGNNNSPNWLTNFTQYRLRQPTKRIGKSGTLTGLVSNPVNGVYQDTGEQMEELFRLSQSPNILFLKDPKGNLFMVHVSSPITGTPKWGTKTMETTFSLPWEEIGNADNCSVVYLSNT